MPTMQQLLRQIVTSNLNIAFYQSNFVVRELAIILHPNNDPRMMLSYTHHTYPLTG